MFNRTWIHGTFALVIASLALHGCGGGTAESGQSGDAEDAPHRIAFVTNQVADFWNIAEAGAEDAANDFDVNVQVRFPSEGTATVQQDVVEDLLASGID
ncbi:MAG: hypothetical protein WD079_06580, partial [Phycisphaeraceae bacterium]